MKTAYQRSCQRIEKEGYKQCIILYSALTLALHRHWGKGREAITRFLIVSRQVWHECAADHDHSMIAMCDAETGIEIQNGSGVSWRDVGFLNGKMDADSMTYEQWVYMRQQEIKWIAPQIMACLLVSLHRKWGFGYDRCARIYQQINDIRDEFRNDPKRIRRACIEETGIDVADVTTKENYEPD